MPPDAARQAASLAAIGLSDPSSPGHGHRRGARADRRPGRQCQPRPWPAGAAGTACLARRLAADERRARPPGTRMFFQAMDAVVDAVGLLAVRNAWAASTLCEQVGAPLTFDQLCRIAYDATAISGSKADDNVDDAGHQEPAPLAIERFQYLLVQFLRIRGGRNPARQRYCHQRTRRHRPDRPDGARLCRHGRRRASGRIGAGPAIRGWRDGAVPIRR